MKILRSVAAAAAPQPKQDEEIDLFGQYVAARTRKLSKTLSESCTKIIQEPHRLLVLSKIKRMYIDPKSKQSTQ